MEDRTSDHLPMQAGAERRVSTVFNEERQGHEVDANGLNLLWQGPTRVLNRVRRWA